MKFSDDYEFIIQTYPYLMILQSRADRLSTQHLRKCEKGRRTVVFFFSLMFSVFSGSLRRSISYDDKFIRIWIFRAKSILTIDK